MQTDNNASLRKTDEELILLALQNQELHNEIEKLDAGQIAYWIQLAAQNLPMDELTETAKDNLERFVQKLDKDINHPFENKNTVGFLLNALRDQKLIDEIKNHFLNYLENDIKQQTGISLSLLEPNQKLQSITQELDLSQKKAIELKQNLETSKAQIVLQNERIEKLEKVEKELRDKTEELSSKNTEVDRLKTNLESLDNEKSEFTKKINQLDTEKKNLEKEKINLESRNQELLQENQANKTIIQKLQNNEQNIEKESHQDRIDKSEELDSVENKKLQEKLKENNRTFLWYVIIYGFIFLFFGLFIGLSIGWQFSEFITYTLLPLVQ